MIQLKKLFGYTLDICADSDSEVDKLQDDMRRY